MRISPRQRRFHLSSETNLSSEQGESFSPTGRLQFECESHREKKCLVLYLRSIERARKKNSQSHSNVIFRNWRVSPSLKTD